MRSKIDTFMILIKKKLNETDSQKCSIVDLVKNANLKIFFNLIKFADVQTRN